MMHTFADIAIILGQTPELSLVVKMTIAAALGLAAVRFARATRASVRHLVLTSTFAALLALPVAMLLAPAIAIELPSASAIASRASTAPTTAATTGVGGQAAAAVNSDGNAAPPRADRNDGNSRNGGNGGDNAGQDARAASAANPNGFVIWLTAVGRATGLLAESGASGAMASGAGSWLARASWLSIVRAVWLGGAVLMLGMFAIALIQLRAVRRTGLPWLERRDDVARLASETGVNRPVTVMFHERISTPLTCGWRNPVILFPTDARDWSDGDVRRVLLHELEHVRRGDWLVLLAARAICAIYWFHPLVWMAWRQLCLEAERACDDAVVRSEAETDYAEQLVQLARRMSNASAQPMVAMASRSDLSARVTALLDARQQRGRAGIMTFVAAAGAAAFIVITIGPLRAVAATDPQAVIADNGGGSGSGSGSGAGVGRGAGQGAGSGAGGSSAVIASVPGGIAGGVVGGEPGGVVGGAPGGVAVGRPGAVIANEAGSAAADQRRWPAVDRALGEALIEAASSGNVRAVQEVLEAGVDVNAKIAGDGSALIAAARRGQIAAMRYLLERGADVDMGVEGDGNPLIAASAKGQIAAVTLLLERGADIEALVDGDENALIQAAGNGHLDVVKLLVARGANVNASLRVAVLVNGVPQTEFRSPLSMARRGGHAAVVAFLQSAGAVE